MALVAVARGGAKQATPVIGGAFVAAGKASTLGPLTLRRAPAGSGSPAYLVGVRPFSRAGRGPVWPRACPRAAVGDARLAVVGRRVMPPHRLVQSRQYFGMPAFDPKALEQFIQGIYKAIRAWIDKGLSCGNDMINSLMSLMDGEAVRGWVFNVLGRGKNILGGKLEAATTWVCTLLDCGKDFLISMIKFVVGKLAEADARLCLFEDRAKEFLVRIWMILNSSLKRKSGSAIIMPVKEYFEGFRNRLVSLFIADSAGTGDMTPLAPKLYMDLLVGVWNKVHSIDRTMHLPPAKTKLRVLLDLVLEEQKGGFVHKKLVTAEEFYSMIWKVATIVCSVSAYIELKVTPVGAFKLHLRWLAYEAKKKLNEANEQDSDEQLSPGSDDTGSKVGSDSVNSGDCAVCKFCIKICSYFCSDKNAVQSAPAPSPEQKTESDRSAVCKDSDVRSHSNAEDKTVSDGSVCK